MRTLVLFGAAILALALAGASATESRPLDPALADAVSLSTASIGSLPADPSNKWADDRNAASLGHKLFFDPRFSANGKVSCATCHDPARGFQDSRPLAKGVGTTDRRTMPIAGTAHSPFLFWDGRKDSQWAQALGPLESPVEHGGHRTQYAQVVAAHYRGDYERVFGPMPDVRGYPEWNAMTPMQRDEVTRIFVNVGKAIAAYERQIGFGVSKFDRFVSEWQRTGKQPRALLSAQEIAGLKLFLGKADCTRCHNGPLLTNNEFHNTGVPRRAGLPDDRGRTPAVAAVSADEFNCRSRWSDAKPHECKELEFLAPASASTERAYKVPSLRNVAERAPYMHAGQLSSLEQVLNHYNTAPAAPAGHTELKPLGLTPAELQQLEAFLRTLSGGVAGPPEFLAAPRP